MKESYSIKIYKVDITVKKIELKLHNNVRGLLEVIPLTVHSSSVFELKITSVKSSIQ